MGFTTYEPAPSTAYYHTGIGGAGNYRKLTAAEVASPKAKSHDIKPQARPFYGGRGGVGNAHSASERAMFSFDEELQRDKLRRESVAPMYAVGRGGAGNIVPHEEELSDEERVSMEDEIRRLSESTTGSRYSNTSIGSGADRIVNRLRNLGRH
ncbi:hypothetical protein ABW19_dt0209655 [Dactylella cylindrospora]|nr:hypothetical protein ABW19_dt0209655 [Dactylella cylindrospora]